MGRPPIGNKAMTDAERQRKRRARLADEATAEWSPEYRFGPRTIADQHHNEFALNLGYWLEYSDTDTVTEFLANALNGRPIDENILSQIRTRMEEMDREAIAKDDARQKWLAEHPDIDPLDCPIT